MILGNTSSGMYNIPRFWFTVTTGHAWVSLSGGRYAQAAYGTTEGIVSLWGVALTCFFLFQLILYEEP